MYDLPDFVKHATGLHDHIAAGLAEAGGILRCTCGAEEPLGDVASYLRDGWPRHCGRTMTWVTLEMLAAEKDEDRRA